MSCATETLCCSGSMSEERGRIGIIDALRGFSILLVIVYHFCYDLYAAGIIPETLMYHPVVNVLEQFFASVFILMSGVVCRMSRSNLKRGLLMLACALVITVFTWFYDRGNSLILFGILHFLGAAAVIFHFARPLIDRIPGKLQLFLWPLLAAATWWLPFTVTDISYLWIFGIRDAAFFSADYFPLLPYIFVYFWGTYLGKPIRDGRFPKWFYAFRCPALEFVGKHTLPVYLAHQPLCYALVLLIERMI